MKNLYTTLFLLIFGLITNLPAQTLKNIHRHNLPVLQIPIDLIDKVETVDLNGVKHLQITPLFGEMTQIPTSEIDSITHYTGSVNPEQLGEMRTASVIGIVRDAANAPIMNAIVRSPYGGEETQTDPNGVFFLNDIVVYDKLGYITITKPDFHKASRSFLPLESGSNRVNVQLLPMTQSGSFNAASGGTVTSGLLQLSFPANSVELNGQPYTGTVNVYAAALDPSSPEMFDQMPGELLGGMNDSLRLLRSFGMATVELRDDNMNELQLAESASATLTFDIPSALQAEAPETIDWWSFDETLGYWQHEGEAQKQGNQYVGLASHFSWWNCDVPENFNDFQGSVNTADGTPISDAQVNIITETLGTGNTYTNASGEFSGRVPKYQTLSLNIFLICDNYNDWELVFTEDISSSSESIFGQFETANPDNRYSISGTLVNCNGQPVELGYLKTGPQVCFTENGVFSVQVCQTGAHLLRGFNITNANSILVSEELTVQVTLSGADIENLYTCDDIFGAVTDIDGNIYTTITIGNQIWTAENLKTAHFSDGSEIINIPIDTIWTQTIVPAWCRYNNSITNETIYGKLYNWYTVSDTRNVCPSGWHVPSIEDWEMLMEYLGGSMFAGGKMKVPSAWTSPNIGASNLSGFAAIPSGGRGGFVGDYSDLGNWAGWWSSEEQSESEGIFLYTHYSTPEAFPNSNRLKSFGFAIRCVKD